MVFVLSISEDIQCFDRAANDCQDFIFNFSILLTDHKLIFVNCRSTPAPTGSLSFLLQPKLIFLAVLSSNYLFYDFDATIFQKQF